MFHFNQSINVYPCKALHSKKAAKVLHSKRKKYILTSKDSAGIITGINAGIREPFGHS